jgi:hypothetical protein
MVISIYSFETWSLTKIQQQKVEIAELKVLRNVAGYTVQLGRYTSLADYSHGVQFLVLFFSTVLHWSRLYCLHPCFTESKSVDSIIKTEVSKCVLRLRNSTGDRWAGTCEEFGRVYYA